MEQRTQEWHDARRGLITASRAADLMTNGGGSEMFGKTAYSYANDLIIARLGVETENYTSAAMEWGIEWEQEARKIYNDQVSPVTEDGFIVMPGFDFIGCSPDGLVGTIGLIEIKCPQERAHLSHLLLDEVPKPYWYQMQFQMMVTGRKWNDFISFHPYFPDNLMFKKIRVERNEETIKTMLDRAIALNEWIETQLKKLS